MPGLAGVAGKAAVLVVAALLLSASGASATTFCVPDFHSACPDSGGNVAEADPEEAMGVLPASQDGVLDRVIIAAGTYIENASFEPSGGNPVIWEPYGGDPLLIEGAGPGETVLTSSGTGNIFVFNFSSSFSRPTTMRNLMVRVPASFNDGGGGALQLDESVLEDVEIVSLNQGSDGIGSSTGPGNVLRDSVLRGAGGGWIDDGVGVNAGGSLLVEDVTIQGSTWALKAKDQNSHMTARRVRALGARTYGVAVNGGGSITVENSLFTIEDGIGLYARADDDDASLTADHVTIVNSGGNGPAIEVKKFGSTPGDAEGDVSNSILRGFGSGHRIERPIGPGVGNATLRFGYSNLPAGGVNLNGSLEPGPGNIDADPLLGEDLSIPGSSPSVDAGDPAAGLDTDFLGLSRPTDGDGDGVARRDQGAFEYQPPSSPSPPQSPPTVDSVAPQTLLLKGPGKKVAQGVARFRFRSSEAGSTFLCKLDRRRTRRCRSPRAYRRLKPGRHVFRVWAIDAAGNVDPSPARKRFRVPA